MPIIKSAKKRVKIAAKARSRNLHTKRHLRAALKDLAAALESGKTDIIAKAQKEAASAVDMAAKKNVIHKNKAARMKSKLAAQAKASGIKTVVKKASKPPAKSTKKAASK